MARKLSQLHPQARKKANQLKKLCKKKGLKICITECVRTVSEQNDLYAKGRTRKGPVVTNSRGSDYRSMHQWGVAFDFCRNDGQGAYENDDKFFQKVGKLGKSIGLEWGGDWTSIKDYPHFQLPQWGSTSSVLRSRFKNPAAFRKTWRKK